MWSNISLLLYTTITTHDTGLKIPQYTKTRAGGGKKRVDLSFFDQFHTSITERNVLAKLQSKRL